MLFVSLRSRESRGLSSTHVEQTDFSEDHRAHCRGISKELGEFFSLPSIDAKGLQDILGFVPPAVDNLLQNHVGPIYPRMAVVPMGFSWAFHLAHEAHVEVARRCLGRTALLRDKEPFARLGPSLGESRTSLLIYADNANHVGICAKEVNKERATMFEFGVAWIEHT